MKKLLFLTVSVALVGVVSAQSRLSTPETVPAIPQKMEKESVTTYRGEIPSYLNLNHSPLTNTLAFTKTQKANPDYTRYGIIYSTEYASSVSPNWNWVKENKFRRTWTLFPDSLVIAHVEHAGNPDGSFDKTYFQSMGYTFDPYSKGFSPNRNQRLFIDSASNKIVGYRIDTLWVLNRYNIADYDGANPDVLRIYITSHNAYYAPGPPYTPDPKRQVEYFRLFWQGDWKGAGFVIPIVQYDDPNNIPQKGPAVKPVASSLKIIDYPLSLQDSIEVDNEYLGWLKIPVDYEVPVGHVTSFVFEFIPGYDYDLDDTIQRIDYDPIAQTILKNDVRKNIFEIATITDTNYFNFLDWGTGFNEHFLENKNLRYNIENDRWDVPSFNPDKLHAYYNLYYPIPFVLMDVSVDMEEDNWCCHDLAVIEPNPIVSKIYPNPANNQIRIELVNDQVAELKIVNVLGQVIKVATLDKMDNAIDISSLNSGVHVLRISQGGNVYTTKITKR